MILNLKEADGFDIYKDFVYGNEETFILADPSGLLRSSNFIQPTSRRFLVFNPAPFKPGHFIRVLMVGGSWEVREIQAIDGQMIKLKTRLNGVPALGSQVKRVVGYSDTYIDARIRDAWRKEEDKRRWI